MRRSVPSSRVSAAAKKRVVTDPAGEVAPVPGQWTLLPRQAIALPLAFAAGLLLFLLLPSVRRQPALMATFVGTAGLLAAWAAGLLRVAQGSRRKMIVEVVLRKQHYLQACAHLSIFGYWGWYWREVYDSAHLIAAQLVFAYAFDMLLAWSRRETYTLGFGPFPIIFSTNLFLWFKPEWFYLQFLMVAVGFAAKELIRWHKDGRLVHIFNPSSFPLFLASLLLILTGNTSMTWGAEIANTFERPPYMRLWIFLAGLPGQFLFGVVTMTLSAVGTVFAFGLAYHWIFGSHYFVDGFIPAAVFLGMHLLFTDPSTSPRSEQGRIIFGILYGLAVVALFALLGALGVPTFYDKLLAVPLLNLGVQAIDRWVASGALRRLDPARLAPGLTGRKRNVAYMLLWALVFVAMSDPLAAYRPRRWLPLWQQACLDDRRNACLILSRIESRYCAEGSAWACNDLGILEATGRVTPKLGPRAFQLACARGMPAGCENLALVQRGGSPTSRSAYRQAPPTLADYPILLQEGQGRIDGLTVPELLEAACRQEWPAACAELARMHRLGEGLPRDPDRARSYLQRACAAGQPEACGGAPSDRKP